MSFITLATCFNWLPRPVAGKTVVSVGSTFNAALMSIACWVTSLAARMSEAWWSMVRRKSIELRRATASGVELKPLRTRTWLSGVGAAEIASARVERPIAKTVEPATEVIIGNVDAPLNDSV